MGVFCGDTCFDGIPDDDRARIIRRIRRKLGEPFLQVELLDEQIQECICEAIEEYSTYINNWVLQNRLGEMLGMNSSVDFTMKYISNSLYFEKSFTKAYAEQVGLGANGTRQFKLDAIILSAGTQDYIIPPNREVSEILWYTPSFINLFGLDPFANNNLDFAEFGASFAGQQMYSVMPVFDTILTAQAAELRNRVRGSEYSYILRPGPNGQKILKLFPIPMPGSPGGGSSFGIGASTSTPGTMFYYYLDRAGYYGNPEYSGNTANPGFTGLTQQQIDSGIQGNGLVATPADATLNYISWNQLNSLAETWIKKFAQALAKELLGVGIRGKFSGQLPIPGGELTLNKDDLINTGRDDQEKLRTELKEQLGELSFDKILERRAAMQKSINEALSYTPKGIFRF